MQEVAQVALDGYQASLSASKEEAKSHTEFFVSAFEILGKELLADPGFAEVCLTRKLSFEYTIDRILYSFSVLRTLQLRTLIPS